MKLLLFSFLFLFVTSEVMPAGKARTVSPDKIDVCSPTEEPDLPPLRFGFWIGYSPLSMPLIASMRNAQTGSIGMRVNYLSFKLFQSRASLSGEVTFLGWTRYPRDGKSGLRDRRFGAGVQPVRFSLPVYRHSSGNFLHINTGAGIIMFDRPYPNNDGTHLNASLDVGLGYQLRLTDSLSLDIGYRLHHISNAGSGIINPGLDSNLFVLSILTRG